MAKKHDPIFSNGVADLGEIQFGFFVDGFNGPTQRVKPLSEMLEHPHAGELQTLPAVAGLWGGSPSLVRQQSWRGRRRPCSEVHVPIGPKSRLGLGGLAGRLIFPVPKLLPANPVELASPGLELPRCLRFEEIVAKPHLTVNQLPSNGFDPLGRQWIAGFWQG